MTNRFSVHSKFKIIYLKDKELVKEKIKITASAERFARIHVASQGGMVEYNLVESNMYNENSDVEYAIEEGED